MEKSALLDRLLELLYAERKESVPTGLTLEQKGQRFRALCNVRPPIPVSQEFLKLQDEYLSALTQERGVVRVADLSFTDGMALWRGDITRLDADAIMNACNSALLGCFQPLHNCIDNIIHSNAGIQVRLDCDAIMQGGEEPNGQVEVTPAYNLPGRYIFHTVGPIAYDRVTDENRRDLRNCYLSCLEQARKMELKSIALCCISTGVFRFPQEDAAHIAVQTVRSYLKETHSDLKVVFNVFMEKDHDIYKRLLATD